MLRVLNLRTSILSLAVFGILAVAHGTAKADAVTVSGNLNPNLQATINITSLTNVSITFSVTNVPVAGVTSSITAVGFELPGTITANSPGVCAGGCGQFSPSPVVDNTPGNVPQFNTAVLDWAVITGADGFTGGPVPGIDQGQTATFTVTGNFTGLTQAQILAGVFVRFQSVSDPSNTNVTSDVAHAAIPEPATMLLLGTGLVGVAATVRRRLGKR